jgi:porphobilinogen deaminase
MPSKQLMAAERGVLASLRGGCGQPDKTHIEITAIEIL